MATAKKTVIELPVIDKNIIDIVIVGDTPLITHAWSEKAKRMMLLKQQKKADAGKHDVKIPYNDAMDSAYWLTEKPEHGVDDDDALKKFSDAIDAGAKFGFRADGIKAAAAITPKRTGQKIDGTVMRGAFFLSGSTEASTFELAEIIGSRPVVREDLVRVGGQNKTADLRYRVMFEEWRIPLRVKYLSGAAVSIEQILNAINLSGFVVGIGEWRPERKGQFGMFHVEGV